LAITRTHKAWLLFLRRVIDVTLGYSKNDLWEFRNRASMEMPSVTPLVEAYLRFVEDSEIDAEGLGKVPPKSRGKNQNHLFDLLRDRRFFPQNSDLANFAARVLPGISTYRFDKMSRGDIAARIIEHIEKDQDTREKLESSMQSAFQQLRGATPKAAERRNFLLDWEKIIKGMEL
jgi:hypothetical protein